MAFIQNYRELITPMNKKDRFTAFFFTLYGFLQVPGFLFHEACHILAIWLCMSRWSIDHFYIYRFGENNKSLHICAGSFTVYSEYHICDFLIAIAPLVGYIVTFITFLLFAIIGDYAWCFIPLCYMSTFYSIFMMSNADINTMKKSWYGMFPKESLAQPEQ